MLMRVANLLFGQINYDLSPLKICYGLDKDIKPMHKLTKQNYNQLVISFSF